VAGVETGLPCRHYVLPHRTTLVVVVVLYVHVNVRVKRIPYSKTMKVLRTLFYQHIMKLHTVKPIE
jgi:hypothetical protein